MPWHNDQVADAETERILAVARECLEVAGDFVELGCYRGDTSLLLAELLRGSSKVLWLYDSFEGLPAKTTADVSAAGENFMAGALAVTKREVKERFLRANLPVPHIVKSWFSDLAPDDLPEQIAFAFLDGDLYESIRDSLRLVEERLSAGGIIIVHDYNNPALPGVAKAVDEWLSRRSGVRLTRYQTLAIINI